ncbi:MAG: hypothetical protein GY940_30510 [bacterium]|nr:hypothetical protein [bacterium]
MMIRSITLILIIALFSPGLSGEVKKCGPGHGQEEITKAGETFVIETNQAGQVILGLKAVNRLNSPGLNGNKLAGTLLTGSALSFHPQGFALFSYSDRFSPHFRGRRQKLVKVDDDQYMEDLLSLPEGYPKPKVLLDLYKSNLEGMAFGNGGDTLWWNGDLIYRFDFGFPVEAFNLSDIEGKLKTRVGDINGETGNTVEVSLSSDEENWYTVWSSPFETGEADIEMKLPQTLVGKKTIYLRLRGRETALLDLYVSARLKTKKRTRLLRVSPGQNSYRFSDDRDSSHHAIFFWEGAGVVQTKQPGEGIAYPGSRPTVTENGNSITILFPEQVGIILEKSRNGGIGGIEKILVRQREILSAPPGVPSTAPFLEMVGDGEVGDIHDWESYLGQRGANNHKWPQTGKRELYTIGLEKSRYLGSGIESNSVVLYTEVSEGRDSGALNWRFSPVSITAGETTYEGLGWQIEMNGLERAYILNITEPVAPAYKSWYLAQEWGGVAEKQMDFFSNVYMRESWYFSETQPFFFQAGPRGAAASFFPDLTAARVSLASESGRIMQRVRVPLGKGTLRQSPVKYWLWTEKPFPDKFSAVDGWTAFYDTTANHYRENLGLGTTDPKPALWWINPSEDYFRNYVENGKPRLKDSWFYRLAESTLPAAKEMGFGLIHIDGFWESDIVHPATDYLYGSDCFGSGNALWNLEVHESSGGLKGLKILMDRARELDIKIVLWNLSGDLSNSARRLKENTGWIKWRSDGTPETAGYGDVTGTSLNSGYFDYAVSRYRHIYDSVGGFDGFWFDSFLTFAMMPDFREEQPLPQLNRIVEMQAISWEMGMTNIFIEGCGPLGVSSGGYGYESVLANDPEGIKHVNRRFDSIRGREYLLYRYQADTIIEPDSYYRALASKGIIGIPNLEVLSQMSVGDRDHIARANRDYMQVLDKMQHRRLIAVDGRWVGVAWTNDVSSDVVVFAFSDFNYPFSGRGSIRDITSGRSLGTKSSLSVEPMHTYVISRDKEKK